MTAATSEHGAGGAIARPPAIDLAVMGVAIVAIATSAPLIAATAAPALAIAFWRNAFGTLAIAPFALTRFRAELRALDRRRLLLALAAGLLLSLHFATWVPSLDYTSVASSTALVATQPVWAALLARARGHTVPPRAWVGMAVAITGVLLVTGVDVSLSARAVWGDLLALVGAVFAAGYVSVGGQVRQTVSTTTYTFLCYGTTAVLLGLVSAVGGQALAGYPASDWIKLLALTGGAQLLGHSLFNRVLRTTSPTVASVAILFEAPGATLIAALWLHQTPPWEIAPALALLLAGLTLVVTSADRMRAPSMPVE